MNTFKRWITAPQTHLFRRILFQVHLWLGIGLGLYVLAISISGTAILMRTPVSNWFVPDTLTPTSDTPLEGDELEARMAEVYQGYELGFMMAAYDDDEATYIVLEKDGEYFPHYFNQYTGEDMGASNPWPVKTVEWLSDFHDDLFMDRDGRRLNGLGGVLFVVMALTGLLIWWRGKHRWYEGFIIVPGSSRSLFWQLHSFVGFWTLALMLAWGISGFQFGFPRQMGMIMSWFTLSDEPVNFRQPNAFLTLMRDIHLARFGRENGFRWFWIIASTMPALLFLTGLYLWFRRVVMRKSNSWGRRS